jgi:AraC-like DNA-binding protein
MDRFRFLLNPHWTDLPHCNAVLSGRVGTRDYVVGRYETTLCLKAVVRGSAFYRTRQGYFRVEEGSFLVLNRGQEYSLEIAAGHGTQTLCPFFQLGFVGHVAHCLAGAPGRQLDEPAGDCPETEFYERLYPRQGPIAARLDRLQQRLRSPAACGPWLEDQMYGLAKDLLGLLAGVRREVASFVGTRPATREELYRRLHRARDFMDSCYEQKLSVERIARVACLSPYHFHRTFRLAFGAAPMQWLQARRLRAAQALLQTTDKPITAICLEVGFDSLGTFSWLFRKRFGVSPRQFREGQPGAENRKGEEVFRDQGSVS